MTFIPRPQIEAQALKVLHQTQTLQIPIPVEVTAVRLGLDVESVALGSGVSGVLIVEDGKGIIGFNEDHAYVRQRFTIGHELGHYLLHRNNVDKTLFIDTTKFVSVYLRDSNSSNGDKWQEIQANQFSAALLMPKHLIEKEISQPEYDLLDVDDLCLLLAERFQVSTQAMSYRLGILGLTEGQPDELR